MKTIRDIMTTDVSCCSPQDPIRQAAQIMRDQNVGSVPIVEGKKLIGMLTDRDIAIRCVAEDLPNTTACQQVMSDRRLVTATPEMSVDEAAQLMADEQVRRLPIVENGQLVGIVAIGDLAVHRTLVDEAGQALKEISEPLH